MNEPLTISVEDAARLLGISRGLCYEAARRGELPGVIRLGRRILVSRARLLEFIGTPEMREAGFPASEPLAGSNGNGNATV